MQVKVCDFRSNEFNKDFVDSIINTGFAVITNHGIDHGLIRDTQTAWRTFFNQTQTQKRTFINETDSNMGYSVFGKEQGVGAAFPDLKEFFHWKPGQVLPEEVSALTQKMFYMMNEHLAPQILQTLNGLGSDMDYKEACSGSDNTIIRALYYPALKDLDVRPGEVRASAHEDINFITFLVAATSSGLQVQDKDGNWHPVPHEDNSVVVNVGDMLKVASNGLLKSTTHRVVNPADTNEDRISIPLFIHPKGNTQLVPGFTAQEYLTQRLSEIYKGAK